MRDQLGDRMKDYEMAEAGRRLLPRLPVCARVDGKRFSKFTQGLARPFDVRLSRLMVETTRHLVEESGALVGYTQSDEMNLLWHLEDIKGTPYLDGRVQKITSILASTATAFFNAQLAKEIPEKAGTMALFDCRVWAVPTREDAASVFLWRELDASKNSVSMAARAYYPHEEVDGRNNAQMHEMLFKQGVNWNDYPPFFKRGTFLRRESVSTPFEAKDLEALPQQHAAHKDPSLRKIRNHVVEVAMPPFSKVTNREGVLFDREAPRTAEKSPG